MMREAKDNFVKAILIAGPTASGKSGLALHLAQQSPSLIINADALQIYQCWQILTARPGEDELNQAPHRLYGHIDRQSDYSVGHWLREVANILSEATITGLRPIIVGGTGLYFRALTEGLADIPPIPENIRDEGNILAKQPQKLISLLAKHDPQTLAQIDQQNPVRLQRAWEVWAATGRGLQHWHKHTKAPLLPLSECEAILLHMETSALNQRIDQRFEQMISEGVLDEVRAVMRQGWDPKAPWAKAIGAKELVASLSNEIPLPTAIASAKIQTHQYAKRQRTWFRARMKDWQILDITDPKIRAEWMGAR